MPTIANALIVDLDDLVIAELPRVVGEGSAGPCVSTGAVLVVEGTLQRSIVLTGQESDSGRDDRAA